MTVEKQRYFKMENSKLPFESVKRKPLAEGNDEVKDDSLFVVDDESDDEPQVIDNLQHNAGPRADSTSLEAPPASEPEMSRLVDQDGYDLFKSQLLAVVGNMNSRSVYYLYKKYFNQPNYLNLATNEYFNGISIDDMRNLEEEDSDFKAKVEADGQIDDVVDNLFERMKDISQTEKLALSQKLWSKYIGTITTYAMATRPIMRPLQYRQKLQIKRLGSKPSSKDLDNTLIRVFTDEDRPREIGRLAQDVTNMLGPCFDLNIADFECTVMVETSKRLSVGDSFYLSIDCYLKHTAFINYNDEGISHIQAEEAIKDVKRQKKDGTRVGFNFASETSGEKVLRLKQYALSRLFDRLNMKSVEQQKASVEIVPESQPVLDNDIVSAVTQTQDEENNEAKLDLDQLQEFYLANQQSEYLKSLPETTVPPKENFRLELRDYQKHGLSWMLVREKEFEVLEELSTDKSSGEGLSTQARSTIKENEKGIMNPLWKTYTWPADTSYRAEKLGSEVIDGISSELDSHFYANLHNGELCLEKPLLKTLVRGGILLDAMGLGKTVAATSLITSVPYDSNEDDENPTRGYASKTTLVVVPMSLLSQWKSEFDKANNNPDHQCLIYYGDQVHSDLVPILCGKKKKTPIMMVTTYGTIQHEYQRLNKLRDMYGNLPQIGIYSVKFFRIIIDEGHTIRNRATRTAKAIHELLLSRKWILTGTPVINRLDDLYSLVKFLQLEPWCNFSYWKTFITLPFEQKKFSQTLDVVKSVLEPIFLRRTKDMKGKDGKPLIELPPKEVTIETIKFSTHEENLYNYFKTRANQSFKEGIESGNLLKKYTQILTHILRLRQICCHPDLVGSTSELEEIESADKPDLESIEAMHGGSLTSEEDINKFSSQVEMRRVMYSLYPKVNLTDAECMICTQSPINLGELIITECGHEFCFNCILEHIDFQQKNKKDPFCPACRGPISKYKLFKLRNKETSSKKIRFVTKTQSEGDPSESYPFALYLYDPDKSSSKIEALLRHLKSLQVQNPGEQVIVFSQFSSYLDLIENELSLYEDFIVYKFDGRLNLNEREKLLDKFKNHSQDSKNGKVIILLLSLKAGGVGLNLTTANRAFMMDPWWSPSIEDQAIDRIHRIGQSQSVKVIRFIIENTIENKMLKIQERKRKMGEAVEVEEEERRKRRIEEIQLLFEE